MRYIQNILLFLVVTVLATGCIKDNFDDCKNVTIYFEYKADGDVDVLNQYISKMDLYVFDENGQIRGVGTYNQDELKQNATPSFRLTPGKYKVVAVGNMYDKTEVVNLTENDFDNIFIQHPAWKQQNKQAQTDISNIAEGSLVDGHDDNYMGQKVIEVTTYEVHMSDTVELFSSHIDVEIELNGFPAPSDPNNIPYRLYIEKSNAQTSFNNEINDDEKGTCYPELIYDTENGIYRTNNLRLFRMDHDGHLEKECCEHILVLVDNDGNEIVRGNIYNYIKRNEEIIDVTKQETTLPISITYRGMNVEAEINIPDWVIVDGKPEWK